jgi:outer membrane protein assembly factor BamB
VMLPWIESQFQKRLPSNLPKLGYPEMPAPAYEAGFVGNLSSLTLQPIAEAQPDSQWNTWIPDADFARHWKRSSAVVTAKHFPADLRKEKMRRRQMLSNTASAISSSARDWNCWRGPAGTNHSAGIPDVWDWTESGHVVWKTPIAGRGHSSPIVVNDRIYLTTVDEQQQFLLQSYAAATGTLEWERVLAKGKFPHINLKNSHASTTVACDGERLFVNWVSGGRLWLATCDLTGKIGWKHNVGQFVTEHGYGSSPLLFEGLVIVSADISGEGYLAAFDRQSGEPVWKTPRPGGASYGSPIVAHVAGRDQLILSGSQQTVSYDPRTGNRLWFCEGPSKTTGNTIACDALHVFTSGGNPEKRLLCIRADGSGDVTATHVVWEEKKATCYVPSPLVVGDRLFVLNDKGIANWLNAASGEVLWQERIGGNFTSSPLLVGDRILMTSESGVSTVVSAADEYELLAENPLDAEILATPCVVDGSIYLRSTTHLYCIGETLNAGAQIAESPESEDAASSRQ